MRNYVETDHSQLHQPISTLPFLEQRRQAYKLSFTTSHYKQHLVVISDLSFNWPSFSLLCVLRVVSRERKTLQAKGFRAVMLHEREIGRKKSVLIELAHN